MRYILIILACLILGIDINALAQNSEPCTPVRTSVLMENENNISSFNNTPK
jgi:hypothetical protein